MTPPATATQSRPPQETPGVSQTTWTTGDTTYVWRTEAVTQSFSVDAPTVHFEVSPWPSSEEWYRLGLAREKSGDFHGAMTAYGNANVFFANDRSPAALARYQELDRWKKIGLVGSTVLLSVGAAAIAGSAVSLSLSLPQDDNTLNDGLLAGGIAATVLGAAGLTTTLYLFREHPRDSDSKPTSTSSLSLTPVVGLTSNGVNLQLTF